MSITPFAIKDWNETFSDGLKQEAITALEQGSILHLPQLNFALKENEKKFLSAEIADPKTKNISYSPATKTLRGIFNLTAAATYEMSLMMSRYHEFALGFLTALIPAYSPHLMTGRTSFRPVEISDRITSYRKDDKRLHVDAFPSSPNQGKRILRIFTNINPEHHPRVWRVGEPFPTVLNTFLPRLSKPFPGKSALLQCLHLTKSYRTHYDHFMLQLHDKMKGDDNYQKQAQQTLVNFATGSSWIVQTDQVSHAAMQGQHVLEQTFYLPVAAMQNAALSPLRILERTLGYSLV